MTGVRRVKRFILSQCS